MLKLADLIHASRWLGVGLLLFLTPPAIMLQISTMESSPAIYINQTEYQLASQSVTADPPSTCCPVSYFQCPAGINCYVWDTTQVSATPISRHPLVHRMGMGIYWNLIAIPEPPPKA